MAGVACLFAGGTAVMSAQVVGRPVLGVVCCTRRMGTEFAQAVINRYVVAAMRHADAAALLVPALPELMRADEVVGRLDGLLLTGSPSNVEPGRYGEAGAADAEGPYDQARDAMTAALVEAMLARGRPVFGVCRGLQELNVAFGGSLRRDTSRADDLLRHHAPDDVGFDAMFDHRHPVDLTPGGALHAAFGRDRLVVNSVHFQGIGRLGEGLHVEARAPDGVIEAVSATVNHAPVLAVQWHPEWDADSNLDSQIFFHILGRALRGEALGTADRLLHQERMS
jgi:putative glutamine amidotransferase